MKIEIHVSDLEKIRDAMKASLAFHKNRDAMNAVLHLASDIRYSPLTSNIEAALERLDILMPYVEAKPKEPEKI